ncbi:cytochrome bd ubiquinol oxidase subunit I [Desulfonatronospira thiodismutans ASO3-1]|uniref:Cytochrome bd ubiquinol oxidase subunit I n=1 Tax=Desulfonatronospira thiodismutans ASO3-1 TaxID=555779 RepID=D6SS87_9BACT|nr:MULTISPECIES: cytochrome ubiquinol oxidase subunit I [Desulfonatronospira]EFI33553.1 cytochrome bd ubiquinol oxidase subunit I [Desulfonatronospira thiodismutans ASO3-1]RQD73460.1 MAG: cytochrome ubiquinol oxidase subunit I [Desulfonatronospira sp. MSAO_Bac3]
MDVLLLSRLQFAMTTFVHFIFVPLTLGLSLLVAYMETKFIRTGDETYRRMAKFWGKLFLINFALGAVTGIALEFQFGTNWSRYSAYVGDVFGSLLAIEATMAFFLESTFLGVWIFGWKKLPPKLHNASIWLVALAANLSAFWIIMANGWMQNPVGHLMGDGRAELASFIQLVSNEFAWQQFIHVLSASYVLSGFFVLGISAWHLARGSHVDFFRKSFRIAAPFTLVFALVVVVHGHHHGSTVAKYQPEKLAAMESHWETRTNAPQYLLVIPDPANEGNRLELLPIPGGLSMLAYHSFDAEVTGLKDFPEEDRPPVWATFMSFRTMVALGMLFPVLAAWAWIRRKDPASSPRMLRLLPWIIPLPYVAVQLGWIVAEMGRQPWIVYGMMRTEEAFSPGITTGQVAGSLAGFFAIYGLLVALCIFLLSKYGRKGPAPAESGEETAGSN